MNCHKIETATKPQQSTVKSATNTVMDIENGFAILPVFD